MRKSRYLYGMCHPVVSVQVSSKSNSLALRLQHSSIVPLAGKKQPIFYRSKLEADRAGLRIVKQLAEAVHPVGTNKAMKSNIDTKPTTKRNYSRDKLDRDGFRFRSVPIEEVHSNFPTVGLRLNEVVDE